MKTSREFNELLEAPFCVIEKLRVSEEAYHSRKAALHQEAARLFSDEHARESIQFGPFGPVRIPFFSMGAVSSLNLFDLDEMLLYSFYWRNRRRYKHFVDMGANIGMHSILALRCGFQVRSFEPDPVHFVQLKRMMELNPSDHEAELYNQAISCRDGVMNFCRVKGNTTSSHLTGSKANPYGELEYIDVQTTDARPLFRWADLVKIDIEGHEATVLCATDGPLWDSTDAVVEVGSFENAVAIHEHFDKLQVGLFSQKTGWDRVRRFEDMPLNYKDGSLFISKQNRMPW